MYTTFKSQKMGKSGSKIGHVYVYERLSVSSNVKLEDISDIRKLLVLLYCRNQCSLTYKYALDLSLLDVSNIFSNTTIMETYWFSILAMGNFQRRPLDKKSTNQNVIQ